MPNERSNIMNNVLSNTVLPAAPATVQTARSINWLKDTFALNSRNKPQNIIINKRENGVVTPMLILSYRSNPKTGKSWYNVGKFGA
jgi:hypothetical protein